RRGRSVDRLEPRARRPGVAAAVVGQGHGGAALGLELEDLQVAGAGLDRAVDADLAGLPAGALVLAAGAGAGEAQAREFLALGVAEAGAAAGPGVEPAHLAGQLRRRAGEVQAGRLAR